MVPAESDTGSEISEWELQERREREEERRAEGEEPPHGESPAGEEPPLVTVPTHALLYGIRRR